MIFRHVSFTWMVSILLFPVLFYISFYFLGGGAGSAMNIWDLGLFTFMALIFSMPCLVLGWLCLLVLLETNLLAREKFIAWYLVIVLLILFELLLIGGVESLVSRFGLTLAVAAAMSACIAVTIRRRQFFAMIAPAFAREESNRILY